MEEIGLDPKPAYRKFIVDIGYSSERPLTAIELLNTCSQKIQDLYNVEQKFEKSPFLVDEIIFDFRQGIAYVFIRNHE